MATMDMRFISEIQILDIVFLDLPLYSELWIGLFP